MLTKTHCVYQFRSGKSILSFPDQAILHCSSAMIHSYRLVQGIEDARQFSIRLSSVELPYHDIRAKHEVMFRTFIAFYLVCGRVRQERTIGRLVICCSLRFEVPIDKRQVSADSLSADAAMKRRRPLLVWFPPLMAIARFQGVIV